MKRQEGFTLIELMIVVAIIAIIAAIAIPSLLNARKAGNEASAISSLRTLTTVSEQYRTRFQTYPLGGLTALSGAGYIDTVLGAAEPSLKSGYRFDYTCTGATMWSCTAVPDNVGTTGDRAFFVDQSGVIRFDAAGGVPNSTSSPIDQ